MKKSLSCITLLAAFAVASSAHATLLTWETFGNAGNEVSVAATNTVAGITGLDLVRGAGLNPSGANNSFSSNNWAWDGPGSTRNADDFVGFGFTVQGGNQVENLGLIFGSRSSNTGPGPMALYWSGDSFTNPIHTWTQSGTSFTNEDVDLSALGVLAPDTYEFRIQSTSTTSANGGIVANTGTWRIGDFYDGQNFSAMQFTGDVSQVIPEPSRALLLSIALGTLLMRRARS